jgi:uncharacterized protein (DUF2384 family)
MKNPCQSVTYLSDYPFKKRHVAEEFKSEFGQLWSKDGADRIFRTKEDFEMWLNAPNPGLLGNTPIQYIKSDIKKIADLLGRILYGVLA